MTARARLGERVVAAHEHDGADRGVEALDPLEGPSDELLGADLPPPNGLRELDEH